MSSRDPLRVARRHSPLRPAGRAIFGCPENMQRLIDLVLQNGPALLAGRAFVRGGGRRENATASPRATSARPGCGYGEIGVNLIGSPIDYRQLPVAARLYQQLEPSGSPNTSALARIHELGSRSADINGCAEGIALDVNGLVSEVRTSPVRNVLYTPPLPPSALRATGADDTHLACWWLFHASYVHRRRGLLYRTEAPTTDRS